MTKIFVLLAILLSFSCSKRDPNPELKDEIYSDLLAEREIMSKSVEAAEKELADLEKTIKEAVPQTGQAKSFSAKYFEGKNAFEKLKQQKQYFDIKVEERKLEVQDRYAESLRKGGRKWPDPEEVKIYKAKLKLCRDKIMWDKNKGIVKSVPRGTEKNDAPKSEHGAEPAAAEEHH